MWLLMNYFLVTSVSSWSITSSTTGIDSSTLHSYFNFNISDNTFLMYTTESFDSFSKNAYSDGVLSVNVQFELFFNCDPTGSVVSIIFMNLYNKQLNKKI